MRSKARLARHPMHPMLVMFPTALFPLLLLADVLHAWTGDALFWNAGFWLASLGVLSTIAAMVPGIVDMSAIPDGTKAHRTGLWHALVGTATLLAYAAAAWVRWSAGPDTGSFGLAAGIDALGVLLVSVQGWLGGELVYRHHVGVLTDREGGEPVILMTKGDTLPMAPGPRRNAGPHDGQPERRRREPE